MERRQLVGMAALAEVPRRRRESAVTVARLARELADVGTVPGARRDLPVRRRDLRRHAILTRTAAPDREHHEDQHARHGRDPIG
jgi:hypothetical protein